MSAIWSREFWVGVRQLQDKGQRYGQAVFNTAHDLFPSETNFFRGTSYDPFYDDDKAQEFLSVLQERIISSDN